MTSVDLAIHLLIGLGVSFLGALPFGIVNLSVVDVTAHENFRAGLDISIGASLIEAVHFLLAFFLGAMVVDYLEGSLWVKVFVVLLFLGIGLLFFLKKQKDHAKSPSYQLPNFVKGLILSAINPQAIPFWVFVIAGLQSGGWVTLDPMADVKWVAFFLAGVLGGKLLALVLFGKMSTLLVNRVSVVSVWMNKIIGGILFLIAGWQGVNLLLG